MSNYYRCNYCENIADLDECESHTIRGSRGSYGEPMEPDEELTICPSCERAHDDWGEVEVYELIEELEDVKDKLNRALALGRQAVNSVHGSTRYSEQAQVWVKKFNELEEQK